LAFFRSTDGAAWTIDTTLDCPGAGDVYCIGGPGELLIVSASGTGKVWKATDGATFNELTSQDFGANVSFAFTEIFSDTTGFYCVGGGGSIPPLQRSITGEFWSVTLDPDSDHSGFSTVGINHAGPGAIPGAARTGAAYVGIYVGGATIGCGDVTYSFDYTGGTGVIPLTYVSGDAAGQWALTSPTTLDALYSGVSMGANQWLTVSLTSTPWGSGFVEHLSFLQNAVEITNAYDGDSANSGELFPNASDSWSFEAVAFGASRHVTGTLRIQGCQAPPT
jgi:hypothetical protein